jgi:putative ABC transport system substrate-binding protein
VIPVDAVFRVARHRALRCGLFGFLAALAAIIAVPLSAEAEQAGRIWRVGLLTLSALPDHESLLEGLRDLGYVEGRNLSIERRNAEGHRERLPDLAADLVRAKVDAIVAQSNFGASAAAKATATRWVIPWRRAWSRASRGPVGTSQVSHWQNPS